MTAIPNFPTRLHEDVADIVGKYFSKINLVDTVLVVNSCARGVAVAESDLDFAILVKPGTGTTVISEIENNWSAFIASHKRITAYKQSNQFAHLHLDIINGRYIPTILEPGVASDYFEIEIGNQICYSAPLSKAGAYFQELQKKWLPYYNKDLRLQRYQMTKNACLYDLDHIPLFIKRELYFQALDILHKAFQEYLQNLFIANKTYPIAYNKWIKEQVIKWLNRPDLYPGLSPILSISNIESDEILGKAEMLRELLYATTNN
jgi:predicted nucleotidyltransferase